MRLGRGASDATIEIAAQLADRADEWPEATDFSTAGTMTEVSDAISALALHLRSAVLMRLSG